MKTVTVRASDLIRSFANRRIARVFFSIFQRPLSSWLSMTLAVCAISLPMARAQTIAPDILRDIQQARKDAAENT